MNEGTTNNEHICQGMMYRQSEIRSLRTHLEGVERDREQFRRRVATLEKRIVEVAKDARDQRAGRDHILGLLRSTKMKHGTCQPRERKACTACNAQEKLDKIVSEWKGGAIYPARM